MPAESVRVVPWADWDEWADLRLSLIRGDLSSAQETLALYRLRRPSSLPSSMQATVSLRSLLAPAGDPYARRLALAMAVVRLVNGATDAIQPRAAGASARSVHSLAKALRLPPILVDMRHAATHNALPRLDALEHAARLALAWLEDAYWVPQAMELGMPGEAAAFARQVEARQAEERRAEEERQAAREVAVVGDAERGGEGGADSEADGASPARKRKRSRWTTCPAGDWEGVPVGLLPGEAKPRKLIGVDVSRIIGSRWQPDNVSRATVGSDAAQLAGVISEADAAGREARQSVRKRNDGDRADGTAREGEAKNGSGGEGDTRPATDKGGPRVLSRAEEEAVARMMEQLGSAL